MARRLIVRRQVINCGVDTCGKCAFLDDFENACNFFVSADGKPTPLEPLWNERTKQPLYQRCRSCKSAEVREK